LPPDQLTLFLIAVFICISTLRIVIKKNRVNRIVYNLEVDVDKFCDVVNNVRVC